MNNKDNGAVTLVEAAIVLPITFFIIVVIIYIGNIYYVNAYMQRVASTYVTQASEYIKNPTLFYIEKNHGSYDFGESHTHMPYRQIFGLGDEGYEIESKLKTDVKKAATSKANTLIGIMAPAKITGAFDGEFVNIEPSFFGSTIEVGIKYKMSLVTGFAFLDELPAHEYLVTARAQVNDDAEFIRNIDYIQDLYIDLIQETGLEDKIKDKISGLIEKIKKFFGIFNGGK